MDKPESKMPSHLVNQDINGGANLSSPDISHSSNKVTQPTEDVPALAMTKSQMKKIARRQRLLEKRPEKRRLERERKRLKKLELAAKGESSDIAKKQSIKLMSESDNKFKIVIDMDFEDMMTNDEIGKAAKQCKRIYAINRRSRDPCQLYFSSIKGKILDRFAITCGGYDSWDANVSHLDYTNHVMTTMDKQTSANDNHDQTINEVTPEKIGETIVYLTGDTDEVLPDVNEILKDTSTVFVIGGLVDHNRHKNLCFERAQERKIRTAKLPISENLRLCQRHILSTVTVFEILLNVLSERMSWRESLMAAIPRRKIHPSEFVGDNKTSTDNG